MTDPASTPVRWPRLVSAPEAGDSSNRPRQLSLGYPERPVLWVVSSEVLHGELLLQSVRQRRPHVFLDLRMVPAFSSMDVSRKEFFGTLASCSATYLSLCQLLLEPTAEHHSVLQRARALLEEAGRKQRNVILCLDGSTEARRLSRRFLDGDLMSMFCVAQSGASLLLSVQDM